MAKRFTFRLDTVLKIRKQREDGHKRIVGERLRQIVQVNEQRASIERQIRDETAAIRSAQRPGTIDIQQAMRHRHWLGHLHKNNLEAEARRRFLEAKLAQERAALAEAVKQRRILERLKELQQQRHEKDRERAEVRESDEMTTMRHAFEQAQAWAAM